MTKRILNLLGLFIGLLPVAAQNPYLPLWEHVPDGEPRVFEDPDRPGHQRVYIVGSHDTHQSKYCGIDVHMWSAPADDLSQWRDEGAVFTYFVNGQWDTMYAPDLVETTDKQTGKKTYWLYPHSRGGGRVGMVCRGDRPTGPFTPVNLCPSGKKCVKGSYVDFDPAVFIQPVSDKQSADYARGYRAYAYFGFKDSRAFELDADNMYSVRQGCDILYPFLPQESRFYEASSMRQVGNKYVMIYSGYSGSEYGMGDSNSTLRYAYSDTPLGPWKQGGVLVDSRGIVTSDDGEHLMVTNSGHNTHGSIIEINGQWYVFYHRAPRNNGYARQGLVAPVQVKWDEKPVSKGGRVVIKGTTTYEAADGHEYVGAEVTSEGFQIYGLPPYRYYSAGLACYMTDQNWLQDNYDTWRDGMTLRGIANGGVVGFKYFGFGGLASDAHGVRAFRGTQKGDGTALNLFMTLRTQQAFRIHVKIDRKEVAVVDIPARDGWQDTLCRVALPMVEGMKGKHALYLVADGQGRQPLFDLHGVGFSRQGAPCEQPVVPTMRITVDGQELQIPDQPLFTTNENGITQTNRYQLRAPLSRSSVLQATASDKDVQIAVSPVIDGRASVRCVYKGAEKVFLIN